MTTFPVNVGAGMARSAGNRVEGAADNHAAAARRPETISMRGQCGAAAQRAGFAQASALRGTGKPGRPASITDSPRLGARDGKKVCVRVYHGAIAAPRDGFKPSDRSWQRRARYGLSKRSPLEWVLAIGKLAEGVQAHVASVVWWDFFGQAVGRNGTHAFDRWLREWRSAEADELGDEAIIAGLVAVGYPEPYARARVLRCKYKLPKAA